MQPCISFNKINTFKWYKERCYTLEGHDPTDWLAAMEKSDEFDERIPLGVIYRNDRPAYATHGQLATYEVDKDKLKDVLQSYA